MANNIAFQAKGKTYQLAANATSQTVNVLADGPCNQVLVASHESATTGKPVYIRISANSSVTCTPPNASTPQYCFVVLPGQYKVFTVPQQFTTSGGLYVAFVTETGTGECYITPGEGF